MTEQREFTCPKCGGHHFGSDTYKDESGRVVVGQMVTCQSVVSSKYIGKLKSNSYCGYRCTRKVVCECRSRRRIQAADVRGAAN